MRLPWDPDLEDLVGRLALRPAAAGPAGVLGLKIAVEVLLHLVEDLVRGRPALDRMMFLGERAVEPVDEAVRTEPGDLRGVVFDLLQLQEELIGVLVRLAAVVAAVVAEDRLCTFGACASKKGSTWLFRI